MIGFTALNKSNSLVILGLDAEVMFVSKNSVEDFDSSHLNTIQNLEYQFSSPASYPPLTPMLCACVRACVCL